MLAQGPDLVFLGRMFGGGRKGRVVLIQLKNLSLFLGFGVELGYLLRLAHHVNVDAKLTGRFPIGTLVFLNTSDGCPSFGHLLQRQLPPTVDVLVSLQALRGHWDDSKAVSGYLID